MNVFAIVIGFQAIMTFGGIWPGPSGPAAAESFGGVAELVELGEDVTVSYEPDGEVTGRALDVSEASLTLMVDGSPFELDQSVFFASGSAGRTQPGTVPSRASASASAP